MSDKLRVPPSSLDAEAAVLGGLMLDATALDRIGDLQPEDFYSRSHQLIYRAIVELSEKNRPYDAVTLGDWFEAQGAAEEVDGGAYLIQLANTTPSAANIVAYAEIVREKAMTRRLIEVGTEIVNGGFQPDGRSCAELIDDAEQRVFALGRQRSTTGTVESGRQGLLRTVKELERRFSIGDGLLGISTSLDELDELTAGLQDTDLIILAGRPGMGKSAAMGQLRRAAARAGHKPYTFSLEMSAEQLYMRDIAAEGGVDLNHIKRPALADVEEMTRIQAAIAGMQDWRWWTDDSGGLTVNQIVARIRRMKRQFDIGIAFIDYLQQIDISRAIKDTGSVANAIQYVTRALKACAKELGIPVVLLSQLNRTLEARGDKRPNMSDLRDSGAIEQDADLIIFVHREGYYHRDWSKHDARNAVAEFIVAKARNSEIGTVHTSWSGPYQRYGNLSKEYLPDDYHRPERKSSGGFRKAGGQRSGIEAAAGDDR